MESCGMSAIKYLLFLFNFFAVILGILIVVAASIDISLMKEYTNMGDVQGMETSILLIVVGLLIIFVAAFGCFGAIKESPKLLYIYAFLLILIIIFELSVGIAAAALRPQMETAVKKQFRESFLQYRADSRHKIFWDNLQKTAHCCGVIGPSDYNDASGVPVPVLSCCPKKMMSDEDSGRQQQSEQAMRSECVVAKSYYMKGCEDRILETVHGAGLAVIITGIIFCFLEVIGVVLAIWLAQAIKRERKTESEAATG